MPFNPQPHVWIDGYNLAGGTQEAGEGWQSVVLSGLTMSYGTRASAADKPALPTASISILANDVPEYIVRQPVGRPVILYIFTSAGPWHFFRGHIDSATVTAVRTKLAGHEYLFRVDMDLVSRPAALSNATFDGQNKDNDRPREKARTRLAWLNKAITTARSPWISTDYRDQTPFFKSALGGLGFWDHWVDAKNYQETGVVSAAEELLACSAEFLEYVAHEDRLAARGRSVTTNNLTRLGWVAEKVAITRNPSSGGAVLRGEKAPMDSVSYPDAATLKVIKVNHKEYKSWVDQEKAYDKFSLSYVPGSSLRVAALNSIALNMAIVSADGKTYTMDNGGQATVDKWAALYKDAKHPAHPPVQLRLEDGFESEDAARLWLNSETYYAGSIYVAGSVFNLLRPGASFHAQAGTTLTYDAIGGQSRKRGRWTLTVATTPIEAEPIDAVPISRLNPSASSTTPAGSLDYTAPGPANRSLDSLAGVTAAGLAAYLAGFTTNAYAYADIDPSVTIASFRDVAEGL